MHADQWHPCHYGPRNGTIHSHPPPSLIQLYEPNMVCENYTSLSYLSQLRTASKIPSVIQKIEFSRQSQLAQPAQDSQPGWPGSAKFRESQLAQPAQ